MELFALAHRLVEEHLDEDHVDRAVDNGRHRGHQVKIFVFAVAIRIWKNWDRSRERCEDIVEEEAKAEKTEVKGVTVWAMVPRKFSDSEEPEADGDDASNVQDAVLDLKV